MVSKTLKYLGSISLHSRLCCKLFFIIMGHSPEIAYCCSFLRVILSRQPGPTRRETFRKSNSAYSLNKPDILGQAKICKYPWKQLLYFCIKCCEFFLRLMRGSKTAQELLQHALEKIVTLSKRHAELKEESQACVQRLGESDYVDANEYKAHAHLSYFTFLFSLTKS